MAMSKGGKGAPLPPGSFGIEARALILRRWEAIFDAIPATAAGVAAGAMLDLRVAVRQLRFTMDAAADAFPKPWYRKLRRAADELARDLDEVRDLDMALAAILADRETAPPEDWPGIDRLIARLESELTSARHAAFTSLADIVDSGLPAEVRRRFGERAPDNADTGADGETPDSSIRGAATGATP
jgi:CHAD domain-containing protein